MSDILDIKFYKKFVGKRLRHYRIQQKLTQKDLAERVGITRSTYINIENGSANYGVDTLLDVAYRLNINLAPLFPDWQRLNRSVPIAREKNDLEKLVSGAEKSLFSIFENIAPALKDILTVIGSTVENKIDGAVENGVTLLSKKATTLSITAHDIAYENKRYTLGLIHLHNLYNNDSNKIVYPLVAIDLFKSSSKRLFATVDDRDIEWAKEVIIKIVWDLSEIETIKGELPASIIKSKLGLYGKDLKRVKSELAAFLAYLTLPEKIAYGETENTLSEAAEREGVSVDVLKRYRSKFSRLYPKKSHNVMRTPLSDWLI